jgi:hypothetical protein
MFEILQTLYWSIYGLVDLEHAELNEKHDITELIGKLMAHEKELNIMLEIQVLAWNRHRNVAVFNWLVGC